MDIASARQQAMQLLKRNGRVKNSEFLALLNGDTVLLDAVREDLIFDDIAQDKNGVGLVYIGREADDASKPQDKATPPTAFKFSQPLRIFLSYGHDEHAGLAQRIKADLQYRGHTVWFDAERLKPGGDWERYIEEGIEWVSHDPPHGRVLLLMTPHSVRHPDGYCLNEIARAIDHRLPIVPAMVVEVEPPLSICRIQWLDMRDCVPLEQRQDRYTSRIQNLATALETLDLDFEGGQSLLFRLLNPLPFDADLAQHLPRFTGRQWIFDKISTWLGNPSADRVFWITGGPGIGKTALSCKLCLRREIAAFHLCRHGHDQKADPRQVVRSLAWQLCTQLPEYAARLALLRDLEEVCHNSNVQTLFDRLIIQPLHGGFPAPDRLIVLLIDGLDEATRNGCNELAEFLGHYFANLPDWVRMIITSRPEPEVMAPMQGLKPFILQADSQENQADLRQFLSRELSAWTENDEALSKAIDTIISRSEGVFLYAEWVRREISEGHLQLNQLDKFPQGLGGVYEAFFHRQFGDPNDYRNRYRPLLELLAASYEPLSIGYTADILGWSAYVREEILAAFGSLLSTSGGLLKPFHRTLTDWVTNKEKAGFSFASADEGQRQLAEKGWKEYLSGLDTMTPYMKVHLPRHLMTCRRWEEAIKLLSDPSYFKIAWLRNESELMELWILAEKGWCKNNLEIFAFLITNPSGDWWAVRYIATFMYKRGNIVESERLIDWCIKEAKVKRGKKELQDALRGKGRILDLRGNLPAAMEIHREADKICREIRDNDGLQKALGSQASILQTWGKFEEAMAISKEREQICQELGNMEGLQDALGSQASILKTLGKFEEAIRLYKEKRRICLELGDKKSLLSALGSQALILQLGGRFEDAMAVYKEQEAICLQLGNKNCLQSALGDHASILYFLGKHEEASYIQEDTPLWHQRRRGDFVEAGPREALLEVRTLLERIEVPVTLLSDHITNYLPLRGRLLGDRDALIERIDRTLADDDLSRLRPDHFDHL